MGKCEYCEDIQKKKIKKSNLSNPKRITQVVINLYSNWFTRSVWNWVFLYIYIYNITFSEGILYMHK